MSNDQSWAVVVAALGASILTGLFSFVLLQWQRWRDNKAAGMKEKAAVYGDLHARAELFAHRVGSRNGITKARPSTFPLVTGLEIAPRK